MDGHCIDFVKTVEYGVSSIIHASSGMILDIGAHSWTSLDLIRSLIGEQSKTLGKRTYQVSDAVPR